MKVVVWDPARLIAAAGLTVSGVGLAVGLRVATETFVRGETHEYTVLVDPWRVVVECGLDQGEQDTVRAFVTEVRT